MKLQAVWARRAARAAGALALAGAVIAVGAQAAGAAKAPSLYVSPSGSGTACTKAAPCATIGEAVAIATKGTTIHVAAGTYTEQVQLTSADDGVTIVGSNAKHPSMTTIQPPSSALASAPDTDSSNPQFYTVYVAPGTTGVTLKNLAINATDAIGFYGTDGLSCAQDPVGIYYRDASGTISDVDVSGVDFPAGLAGCQGGLGIYVASDSGSTSAVTITKATLPTATGASFSGPSYPAFDKNGITCDDPGTTCQITDSTVQGMGPTSVIAQNGIQVFGASGLVYKNTVSDDTYTAGGNGNQASGILVLNSDTVNVSTNKVSSSDIDIYAGFIPAFGLVPPSVGTWTINNNTADNATDAAFPLTSRYGEGIEVDSTSNNVQVDANDVHNNDYAGIMLLAASHVTVDGNTSDTNNVGLYVGGPGGPGSTVKTSTDDTVAGNSITGNEFGVLVDGAFTPKPPLSTGPNAGVASGNTFGGNTWSGNFVQAADFSGWAGTTPPPSPILNTWGSPSADTCEPTAGGAPAQLGANYYAC